jgi:hypothetical protein
VDNQRSALEYINSIELGQVVVEARRANVDREERDLVERPTQL